jgi:hypothetical protein
MRNLTVVHRSIILLVLVSAIGAIVACIAWRSLHPTPLPPQPPLEVSLWYWHQPFALPDTDVAQLKSMGVSQLFVRTGTFHKWGDGIRLTMPQQWGKNTGALPITLVFRFDYDVVKGYEPLSNGKLVTEIVASMLSERARAEQAGAHVIGVQLDLDCPTRLLTNYADLLSNIHMKLYTSHLQLSITALPTWFTSSYIENVVDSVDFTVPQYYEAELPSRLDSFATVSRLERMMRGLAAAGAAGRPFYAGVPAFGHALVYDGAGKLRGTFRDMGACAVADSPNFRMVRSFAADAYGKPAAREAYIGEDIFDFVPAETESGGRSPHLIFDLPTPEMIAQHLAAVRANRPPNCRGVILFRYPEAGESLTLPMPALAAAVKGEPVRPDLRVRVTSVAAPWELIETQRAATRPPRELTVTITNVGTANTFLRSDALTVTLHFDRPGLSEIRMRAANSAETYFEDTPGHPIRSSAARANTVILRKSCLAAGETATLVKILIPADGATTISCSWSAVGPGGFDTIRGEIPKTTP